MKLMTKKYANAKKQTGATLITTLAFLILMTLVSVSASKVSILDILVSSNEQQRMLLSQNTENCLKVLANIEQLNTPLNTEVGFQGNVEGRLEDQFRLEVIPVECQDAESNLEELITDVPGNYPCERAGVGSSIGNGGIQCDLFDFQVKSNRLNSGARDKHHRGAGKMIPNSGSRGSIL